MLNRAKRYKGFTVVELLMVIAVIGILAIVVVVGFNGVQQRARNIARTDYARQQQDVLKILLIKTKFDDVIAAMDHTDGWDRACMGTGYTDVSVPADGRGDCAAFAGDPYVSDTATFSALLAKVERPSMVKYPVARSTDGDVTYGPYVNVEWADSTDVITLEYVLEGLNQDCGLKPLVYQNGATNSFTPAGNPKYTASAYGVTECWVAVAKRP